MLKFFPKETNQSPSNYCNQLRVQDFWEGFSLSVVSNVDLLILKHELSAKASSAGNRKNGKHPARFNQ